MPSVVSPEGHRLQEGALLMSMAQEPLGQGRACIAYTHNTTLVLISIARAESGRMHNASMCGPGRVCLLRTSSTTCACIHAYKEVC